MIFFIKVSWNIFNYSVIWLFENVFALSLQIQAKKILVYAINEFSRYGDENVNRQNSARFYCAKLETM